MNGHRLPALAAIVAIGVLLPVTSAAAAPTKGSAAKALQRHIHRDYIDEFTAGDAERVVTSCRGSGKYRGEAQFYCHWRIEGDPSDDARYGTDRPSGTAQVFASLRRAGHYRYLALQGDDV